MQLAPLSASDPQTVCNTITTRIVSHLLALMSSTRLGRGLHYRELVGCTGPLTTRSEMLDSHATYIMAPVYYCTAAQISHNVCNDRANAELSCDQEVG